MSRLPYSVQSSGHWRKTPARRVARSSKAPRAPRQSSYAPRTFSFMRLLRNLFFLGIIGALISAAFLTFAIASLSKDLPAPGRLIERTIPISTKIYDRAGKVLLYDIHRETKRTPASLDQIAPHAKWAAIVAEDKDFYRHGGFRIQSMLRALLVNLTSLGAAQGGSTITQQFIKNAILTREKTLTRKLKELVLAYNIEKHFSKDEILNMYFNEIPYGSTLYGIEAAAQTFFGKSAREVDVVEGALLAALPKAPTRLSPYGSHTDELIGRTKHIIRAMIEEGYLDKTAGLAALKEDPLARIKPRREEIKAPHFVLYVREQLVEKYGEDFVERGGLKVVTTLDWRLQQIAQEEVSKGAQRNAQEYQGNNAALVAQDPKTGQILAMVGSRDYFDETIDGNVNVALRPRQPGSSFKPIVYTAAFKKGFTSDTPLWDVVTNFKVEPKDYEPHNYDDQEHGLVTMRQALAGSLNIPAVKTLYLTGVARVLDLADSLGYTTFADRSRFGLALVLGGGEVKLLEHVGAFATLANDGARLPQAVVLRIEDASGRVLEEWQSAAVKNQVVDAAVVREITSILSDNSARAFIFGPSSPLILKDRPVAAKTGTTNDWRDGWTLGFTPALTVGVWAGNNDNTPMKQKADGVLVAAPIWNAFMSRALKDAPVEQFLLPDPRPVGNPLLRGQGLGATTLKVNKLNGLLAAPTTPPELIEERTFQVVHSELFYFNPDDPNAPPPLNPGADPNFENFEAAVLRYAQAHGFRAEPPPMAYDTPPLLVPDSFFPITP